jgi:hypothetical protein
VGRRERRRGRRPEPAEGETLKNGTKKRKSQTLGLGGPRRAGDMGEGSERGLAWRWREERAERPTARARVERLMAVAAAPCAWDGRAGGIRAGDCACGRDDGHEMRDVSSFSCSGSGGWRA